MLQNHLIRIQSTVENQNISITHISFCWVNSIAIGVNVQVYTTLQFQAKIK